MILESAWPILYVAGAILPGVGILGRFLGESSEAQEQSEEVDDLLDDTFDDGIAFGDEEDDPLGEGDPFGEAGGDAQFHEVESDVEDVKDELGQLSSTVSTVRSENEEIAEIVEELEGDIRKLLEIYEMVTRGINPFVDDDPGFGGASGGSNAGFALFEEEAPSDPPNEADLGDEVLNADPEEFFDESALDEPASPEQSEGQPAESTAPEPDDQSEESTASVDSGGAKSFDELKEEYETGQADWADETEDSMPEQTTTMRTVSTSQPEEPADPEPESASTEEPADQSANEAPEPASIDEPADTLNNDTSESVATDESGSSMGSDRETSSASPSEKPYLSAIPTEPIAEVALFEWLEALVETADLEGALGAIYYYGEIGWIETELIDELEEYLAGFGPVEQFESPPPVPETFDQASHVRSLRYLLTIENATTSEVVGTYLEELNVSDHTQPLLDAVSGDSVHPPVGTDRAETGIDSDSEPGVTLPDGGFDIPPGMVPAPEVGEDGH